MTQLAAQRTNCKSKVQDKVKKDWKRAGVKISVIPQIFFEVVTFCVKVSGPLSQIFCVICIEFIGLSESKFMCFNPTDILEI